MKLVTRVRAAALAGIGDQLQSRQLRCGPVPADVLQRSREWQGKVVECTVSRVCMTKPVQRLLMGMLRGAPRTVTVIVGSLIVSFWGEAPAGEGGLERVSVRELRQWQWRIRPRRREGNPVEIQPWRVGQVVSKSKHLVRIEKVHTVVDVALVAAAIDSCSWFCLGGAGSRSWLAWHAARLHHRCRLLFSPDTACERMGSYLRLMWDPRQGSATPSAFADRLRLVKSVRLNLAFPRLACRLCHV